MIQTDGGDNGGNGVLDDVGTVQPSAKAGFQQEDIGWVAGEGFKRNSGGDFEERYIAAIMIMQGFIY